MAPRDKTIRIEKAKLLLVEGADALHFFISALGAFGVDDVQVINFGGITELPKFLKTLSNLENYESVTTIAVARDAETDTSSAIQSVKKSFKEVKLPVPGKPFEFAGDNPRTAFMLFPGSDGQDIQSGTLEDLCLEIVKDTATFECVDQYIGCLKKNNQKIERLHKIKLHSYLAGKDEFTGLKIGEATKAGAWDWNHDRFKQFKNVIQAM
ncbi:MAG: hypothetical protein M0022_08040 [Desulfobacteraceae bacterium]|nr:hypothetical protein [Desulfobacteraceae bacterium]